MTDVTTDHHTQRRSNMFVRVLRTREVRSVEKQLRSLGAEPTTKSNEMVEYHAPDGDLVFAALLKCRGGPWICRFHREVFSEEVVQQ